MGKNENGFNITEDSYGEVEEKPSTPNPSMSSLTTGAKVGKIENDTNTPEDSQGELIPSISSSSIAGPSREETQYQSNESDNQEQAESIPLKPPPKITTRAVGTDKLKLLEHQNYITSWVDQLEIPNTVIDTGCTVNLVDQLVLDSLPTKYRVNTTVTYHYRSPDGNPGSFSRSVTLPLNIAGVLLETTFLIRECSGHVAQIFLLRDLPFSFDNKDITINDRACKMRKHT